MTVVKIMIKNKSKHDGHCIMLPVRELTPDMLVVVSFNAIQSETVSRILEKRNTSLRTTGDSIIKHAFSDKPVQKAFGHDRQGTCRFASGKAEA